MSVAAFSGRSASRAPQAVFHREFTDKGDFLAMHAAERFLDERGFSFGPTQGHDPRAIMFGDYLVSKWGNLSRQNIADNHGVMFGVPRTGPITVVIYSTAPKAARAAVLS